MTPAPSTGATLGEEWDKLVLAMIERHPGLERGRMMSADALLCKGKVFAFFSTRGGGTGLGARVCLRNRGPPGDRRGVAAGPEKGQRLAPWSKVLVPFASALIGLALRVVLGGGWGLALFVACVLSGSVVGTILFKRSATPEQIRQDLGARLKKD